MSYKSFIIFIITSIFFACTNTSERVVEEYFDMEVLVAQQIELLNRLQPQLHKKAIINGLKEEKSRRLDGAEWLSELSIFSEANINKPRLIGNYDKEIINVENNRIIFYKAKEPDNEQVQFLKLIYNGDNLKTIESLFTENNILYTTHRSFTMNFNDNQGEPILSDYLINGGQKMILKDTIQYIIRSEVIF